MLLISLYYKKLVNSNNNKVRHQDYYSSIIIRPTLMGTKNLNENGPNPFLFLFFSILWEREWSRFV